MIENQTTTLTWTAHEYIPGIWFTRTDFWRAVWVKSRSAYKITCRGRFVSYAPTLPTITKD